MPSESELTTTDATDHPTHLFRLAEVLRIGLAVGVAGGAIGYLVAHYNDESLEVLARILGAVALTAVVIMFFEAPRRRRIDRVDRGLQRLDKRLDKLPEAPRCETCYAEGYVDGIQRRPPGWGGERHLRSV